MDLACSGEEVVERVAPSGGDHSDPVGGAELKSLAVEAGILPAGVVDEL